MQPISDLKLLIIDVESIGLYGEAFAVAGALFENNTLSDEFVLSCPPRLAEGDFIDREWVAMNVPPLNVTHANPRRVREAFWARWEPLLEDGGYQIAAECSWPVEANFLAACVRDDLTARLWKGPYPLLDISSILLAAGMDPMTNYDRLENEQPKHHPMADVRQSARLLQTAIERVSILTPFEES